MILVYYNRTLGNFCIASTTYKDRILILLTQQKYKTQSCSVLKHTWYHWNTWLLSPAAWNNTINYHTVIIKSGNTCLHDKQCCFSAYGGHLEYLKLFKGESFTPTWKYSKRPYRWIIKREKNFTREFWVFALTARLSILTLRYDHLTKHTAKRGLPQKESSRR